MPMVLPHGIQLGPMTESGASTRILVDWIDSFVDYAKDPHLPDLSMKWSAISAVAAILERRVYCRLRAADELYPNLYVMLVSPPAVGKSSAIGRATRLTRAVRRGEYSTQSRA